MQHFVELEGKEVPYNIVRTKRRTIGIVIDQSGDIEIRIPGWVTVGEVERFVEEKKSWIIKTRKKMASRNKVRRADWDQLKDNYGIWMNGRGGELFKKKVDDWAEIIGVTYNRLSLRDVSSRWGSCTSKGNIMFSWKVFAMPERVVDYLIVHELVHRKYMNHSTQFWEEVGRYVPEYKKIKKELVRYS